MSTIAFIGLGIMGAPMARHLLDAGHNVIGMNRSPGPVQKFIAAGGRGAETVAEGVREADVIITMVPDSPDVEGLALGEDGIYANAPWGSVHIDMSSIRPDVATRLAEAGRQVGVRALDAPVSGGETGAVEAKLSIMVGAEAADFDEVKPILELMGSTVVLVGPPGSGQTVKAANQLIVAGTIELLAEAIVFLRAYGVDTEAAVAVLAGGLAGSRLLDRKAAGMLAGEFQPGFRVDLHHKWSRPPSPWARSAPTSWAVTAPSGMVTFLARAASTTMPRSSALLRGVERLSGHAVTGG